MVSGETAEIRWNAKQIYGSKHSSSNYLHSRAIDAEVVLASN